MTSRRAGVRFNRGRLSVAVRNVPDTAIPVVQSAATNSDGTRVILNYNENLNPLSGSDGVYTLANTASVIASIVSIAGTQVILATDTPILASDTGITIDFTAGSNPLTDLAGNVAANFSALPVANNVSGGVLDLEIREYSTADDWPCPSIAGTAIGECWAAGAGATTGVRAGGGGAYARVNAIAYTPGGTIPCSPAAASTANTAGGNSTINTTTVVAEGGGQSGTLSDGGRASSSTGDVKFDGGAGAVSGGTNNGGGGAGSAGAGVNNTPGAPDGGVGGTANNANSAKAPGGGGLGTAAAQRGGAPGRVRFVADESKDGTYPNHDTLTYGRDGSMTASRDIVIPPGSGGKLLLIISGQTTGTISAPGGSGWAAVGAGTSVSAGGGRISVFEAPGTEMATTFTTSDSQRTCYICIRIQNAGTIGATFTSAASVNADPPNHNPGTNVPRRWYACVACMASNTTGEITAPPTGWPLGLRIGAVAVNQVTMGVWWLDETAASKDPPAVTSQNTDWSAVTIGVAHS